MVSGGFKRLHVVDRKGGLLSLCRKMALGTAGGLHRSSQHRPAAHRGGSSGLFSGSTDSSTFLKGKPWIRSGCVTAGKPLRLDFAIRCDDFHVSFYDNNAPKEFRSSLSILKEGRVVHQKDIIVNDPLRYEGINLFQSSYGELPPEMRAAPVPLPETIRLNLTRSATGKTYEKTLRVGEALPLPEGEGTLVIEAFQPAARFRGQNIGAALTGRLTRGAEASVEILLPLRFPNFDKMRRGGFFISIAEETAKQLSSGMAANVEKRYYTGLQVTRDPGVWVVYSGFVLMILGCFVTFFLSHQQICIEVVPRESGSRIMVAGISNRNRIALQNKIREIAGTVAAGGHKASA